MKIKSITFKAPEPRLKVAKLVMVYISEKYDEIIIAPYFKDGINGISYEQPNCEIISLNSSSEEIGQCIKVNFDKFNIKKRSKEKSNKSDWPAFKASKEKTMRGFENNYRRISISGLTDRNSTMRIETVLNLPTEIELTSTISAYCEPIDLGNRIMKIFLSEIENRK